MTVLARRARPRRASRSQPLIAAERWTGRAIEASWLAVAFVTPLIILSEDDFLSKTELPKVVAVRFAAGLIAALLLAEAGLRTWNGRSGNWRSVASPGPWRKIVSRTVRGAENRVLAAVAAVLLATALSTAFALYPSVSLRGADPSGESYSFYSMAAYAVLFYAVATRIRKPVQVWRLAAVIAAAGLAASLVGIAQHFGYAPFGIRSTSGSARVTGTTGNPIFFGAILATTLSLTIGFSLLRPAGGRWRGAWIAGLAAAASVQVVALLLTLSRGPWLGAAAGAAIILVLGSYFVGWWRTAATAAMTTAAVLAALVFLSATDPTTRQPAPELNVSVAAQKPAVAAPSADGIVATVLSRGTAVDDFFDADRNPRLVRWQGALDLVSGRPAPPVGADPGWLARTVFGYGPDTFPDVLPLVAPSKLANVRTPAAHNDPLNRWVETGLLGLAAWILLWGALAAALLTGLWHVRRGPAAAAALLVALSAGLGALFVESMFGIPRSGDSLLFWLLAGLVVAGPRAFASSALPGREVLPNATRDAPSGAARAARAATSGPRLAVVLSLGVMAIGIAWLTWTETVDRLRADNLAASAAVVSSSRPGTLARIDQIDRAIKLAPDVSRYHSARSDLFGLLAAASTPGDAVPLLRESAASARRALELNPLDRDLNFRAAFRTWEVAKTGDAGAARETYEIYVRLAGLTPRHPVVAERLAAVGAALGIER